MTTLTNFLDQWQKDAIETFSKDLPQAPIIAWCPVCETRERRKAFSPYCSQICAEAAKRKELMDRR